MVDMLIYIEGGDHFSFVFLFKKSANYGSDSMDPMKKKYDIFFLFSFLINVIRKSSPVDYGEDDKKWFKYEIKTMRFVQL